MKNLFFLVLACLLCGCGQYSVRNIDKPPPEDYETWTKDNQTELEIKKSLLECGAIAPSTLGWPYKDAFEKIGVSDHDEQMNNYFLTNKCMENAGYRRKFGMRSSQEGCSDLSFPERKKYPACQIDAEIPTPSVERRLNSWYCKVKSDYKYCLEHALAPKLCSREKVLNPPPECLPPGQEYQSSAVENQPEQKRDTRIYEQVNEYPEKSLQLQQEMQRDSNRQMDNLLRNTVPKVSR